MISQFKNQMKNNEKVVIGKGFMCFRVVEFFGPICRGALIGERGILKSDNPSA